MKLLAIDTATEWCSVALELDGEITERSKREPRAHADNVLPFVSELLDEAGISLSQLDGIAFGRGPGGFTGLRVAASVAQGLAFGADVPIVGISDLAALAFAAFKTQGAQDVAAALDARMGELYYGVYHCDEQGASAVIQDSLASPDGVVLTGSELYAAGPGWSAYRDALPDAVRDQLGESDDACPSARAIAALAVLALDAGQGEAPETGIPVYIRDEVAKKKAS